MQTLINGSIARVESAESLSDLRKRKALERKYRTVYSKEGEGGGEDDLGGEAAGEGESLVVPPSGADEDFEHERGGDEERSEEVYFGKDVVVAPLAYYTLNESLKGALNDYKKQLARTVALVMKKRAKYGQRAAALKDKEDVLGEYPEKNTVEEFVPEAPNTGPGLKVKRHYFTRPVDNVMYRISIDESSMGVGQARRNSYMLVDMAVIFYRKNGTGLGKEIVLRNKVLRFRKRAPRNAG
jgi:hypothetical protein